MGSWCNPAIFYTPYVMQYIIYGHSGVRLLGSKVGSVRNGSSEWGGGGGGGVLLGYTHW